MNFQKHFVELFCLGNVQGGLLVFLPGLLPSAGGDMGVKQGKNSLFPLFAGSGGGKSQNRKRRMGMGKGKK